MRISSSGRLPSRRLVMIWGELYRQVATNNARIQQFLIDKGLKRD